MRKFIFLLVYFGLLAHYGIVAQEMTPKKLENVILKASDTLVKKGASIQFLYKATPMICIYDDTANRMRIISPIIESSDLEENQLLNMLVANFHSALDVKYALSDEIIWSVFLHPLRELSEQQILDAIDQVYLAKTTFGTSYSSTTLVFPGNTKKREYPKPKNKI